MALRLLARRPCSVAELRQALGKKFPANSNVEDAIARLRARGFLDDQKFAEQFASSLARNRGFGPYRLRRELKARLVDYRFIEPAVRQAFEEVDERALLERTLDRKFRTLKPPFTRAKLNSLCQSLLRRGFAADAIMKAVRARPELQPAEPGADLTALEIEDEE